MLRRRDPVDRVVSRHHRPWARFCDRDPERLEIDLMQGSIIDLCADRKALVLLVVADEMLDTGADSFALDPPDIGRRDRPGQHRVLGEALEVPPGDGNAGDVHSGSEKDVGALGGRLVGERPPHLLDQSRVPGRSHRGTHGKARR